MAKLSRTLGLIAVASIGLMAVESFSMLSPSFHHLAKPITRSITRSNSGSTCARGNHRNSNNNGNINVNGNKIKRSILSMSNDDGVVELATDEDEETKEGTNSKSNSKSIEQTGGVTFLSQGEIDEETLVLTDDPKQARVIIYIILSLIPVLFLIPLMLGSRDLIPLDALPPVTM